MQNEGRDRRCRVLKSFLKMKRKRRDSSGERERDSGQLVVCSEGKAVGERGREEDCSFK